MWEFERTAGEGDIAIAPVTELCVAIANSRAALYVISRQVPCTKGEPRTASVG